MYRRISALLFFLAVALITSCTTNHKENELNDIPSEALSLVETYMDALKQGVNESVKYMHFEDDWIKNVYLESNDQLRDYKIESNEMINSNLIAFTIHVRSMVSDETGRTSGEGTYETGYNFVARVADEWRVINGIRHIPAELRDNFDESKYSYSDTNIVDPNDVLYNAPITLP